MVNLDSPASRLAHARSLHHAGKVKAALAVYRDLLKADPKNFDVLCLSTMAQVQLGRPAEAAKSIARALALSPANAVALNAQGNVFMELGKRDRAIESFRAAVKADPGFADAHLNLGGALAAGGDREAALAAFDAALAARPGWPDALLARATQFAALGSDEEALAGFDAVLARRPRFAPAHYNRGTTLKRMERLEEAMAAFRSAIAIDPNFVEAHNNLANTLTALRRYDEAIPAYRAALALRPEYPVALYNLGNALVELGRHDEALVHYADALRLDPDYADAGINMCSAKLAKGRWREGWDDYEYRLRDTQFRKRHPPVARIQPLTGDPARDLAGKSVLIYREQGLGDGIMFASMIPDAVRVARRIAMVCHPRLKGLFVRSFPDIDVIAQGQDTEPEGVERRYMIGSLGRLFRKRREDFPGTPYLVPDPACLAAMRARLDGIGPRRKVGIMWRGGVGGHSEKQRSLTLDDMAAGMGEEFHWVSLNHLDSAAEEVAAFTAATGRAIHHWPEVLQADDYDETVALLAALDTVFTVTCTVGHCCGALGVPVHVLVPRAPEWRYGTEGSAIPWYRSMTMYRQDFDSGAWPIAEALAAIRALK
jgi:tetratricopeptide (TPR) repeat protein